MQRKFLLAVIVLGPLTGRANADDKSPLPPDAGIPIIDWKDAAKHLEQRVVVQGTIVQSRNIGKICFLNFDTAHSFVAIVREPSYPSFSKPPEQLYDQKIVRIRGIISEYNGKPQIEIFKPGQVTLLESALPIPTPPKAKSRAFNGVVTIGTFNVLNLFDDYDDPYHDDEGTPPKPREALEKLAATIHSLDADVLALEEVENRGYLERFVAAMLPDMGYQEVVCFEGNDLRGIDCAILSRFSVGPVTSYRHLHFPNGSGGQMRFQRDFLKIQIVPPSGPPFFVFTVHLKSKRGPAEESDNLRLGEAQQARKILDAVLSENKDALFLVCGDFNDTWDSAPIKAIRGDGATQLQGFFQDLPKDTSTYNEGEHIEMIDFIIGSPAMAKRYVAKSYGVITGSPEALGSDHNPVVAQFKMK